jgi:1-acyl-sn-glycerol-3-phosphate acyltransferase
MIAAFRFCLSLLVLTFYHAMRVIVAGARHVRFEPGGIYDRVPGDWSRAVLEANRIPVRLEGEERLAGIGPCVFVPNHQSWMDVWAVCAVLPGSLRFVAKEELLRVPFFGPALRTARHIIIDRRNRHGAVAAYEHAAEDIRSGLRAVIFAEGTRSRDGRLLPFKKGPFVLALVAQVPVVPVYIEGSYEVLPKGSARPRPRLITVHVGAPIPTTGLAYEQRDAVSERCREAMIGMGARPGAR